MNIKSALFTATAFAVFGFSANATTVYVGGTPAGTDGQTTSIAGATVYNFNDGATPAGFTLGSTAKIVSGSLNGVYAAPAGDTSKYVTTGTSSVTVNFANPIKYLGFYASTIDDYNWLTLTQTDGKVQIFNGYTFAPGVTVDGAHSAYINLFADSKVAWSKAVFSSSTNAFEFDNLATTAAPEPASIATMATGLMAVGAGLIRRRKQAKA